jgi:hypothetical protein
MRESYGRSVLDPAVVIPAEVEARRYARTGAASLRTSLVWAEHCTECAMPACYTNYELYTAAARLHCRRFYTDLAHATSAASGDPWLAVHFRKWGRLQAHGVPSLYEPARAGLLERLDDGLGRAMNRAPMQHGFRMRLVNLWTRKKGHVLHAARSATISKATHFVSEVFNPVSAAIGVILTIRQEERPNHYI